MFKAIYFKELKRNFTSIAFYLFSAVIFILTAATVQNTDTHMVILFPIRTEWHNAPLVIAKFFAVLSVYSLLFTIVITGRSVAKDFSAGIHPFFFTLPITKLTYLSGRFLGALTANLIIFLAVVLGIILSSTLIDPKFTGPFNAVHFFTAFIFVLIPNVLFSGAIFFAFATLTRKMVMTYVSGVILLILYGFLSLGLLFVESDLVKILIDPFGIASLNTITENWTVSEINTNAIPLTGLFLLNRLIWLVFSIIILLFTWYKFKMVSVLEDNHKDKREVEYPVNINEIFVRKSNFTIKESTSAQLYKCFHIAKKEFKRVTSHPAFIILTILASATAFMNFYMNVDYGGNNLYPTTAWYLEQCDSILAYTIPMIIFFGGVIVWRERDNKSNQFFDTLPLPDWTGYLSKLCALFFVIFLYMLLIMFTGIFTQTVILNWTNIELGLYFRWLFGIEMLYYFFQSVMVLFILNLAKNKYLGFFICAIYFAADVVLYSILKFEVTLLRFGNIPSFIYSDVNGFGHYSEIILWYTLHWIFASVLLAAVTVQTWRRNEEAALKYRFKSFFTKITGTQKTVLAVMLIGLLFTTVFLGYNKYFLNYYISNDGLLEMRANYEKNYLRFQNFAQPTVTHVDLKVDFYPDERGAKIKGSYFLKNKSDQKIDSIFLNLSERKITQINQLQFSKDAELTYKGFEFGFSIYKLKTPLSPGDSIRLNFDIDAFAYGISDKNPKNELAENGSKLNLTVWSPTEYFPTIGYESNYNLTYSTYRERYGLPLNTLYPKPEEVTGKTDIIRKPFITYNAVISTTSEQTAITNGDLIRQWGENNRSYFHYKSDVPMACEIQLISGEYEIKREKQGDVLIEVYYDKKHPWNVDRILSGAKNAMEYCSENFLDYPYNAFKVVEVPKYMQKGAARAQPSLIVWREDVGFLTQVDDADGIDQLFGITAHELTHNWWPDVVIPAYALGLEMMAEAIAEYVRVMTVEKEYGKEMSRRHLKREMEEYLSRRSQDIDGEKPFKYASMEQYYISYQKGTASMYALQDYIGEKNVNSALRNIIGRYGFSEVEHPTSIDMINEYRKVTPDSLQYLVTDLFEKITLYENEAVSASYKKLAANKYLVKLNLECRKFYADSIGSQTEVPVADYIYVGIIGEAGEELYMKKHKFDLSKKEFEIVVDQKPAKAGIDPNVILIDRNRANNIMEVSEI